MLYTHGRELVPRKQLNLIPVPDRTGQVTEQWQGLNHGKLATAVVKRLEAHGLQVVKEMWYVNPNRTDLFGAVDIAPSDTLPGLDIGQDAFFSMGVRHSNVGKYAVSFCVGARIVVCENGLFTGDFTLKRRHLKGQDLEVSIDTGIERYLQEAEAMESFIHGLQGREIDDRDAAHTILQTHAEQLINFRYLEDVDRRWRNPPHEEFAPRTAWSLYNAFTESAKRMTPPRQLRLLTGMRPLFEREFQLSEHATPSAN